MSPADQQILEIATSLCQKLNIRGKMPDWVAWHGYAPGGSILTGRLMTVPYDGCVFDDGTIILAEGFRDELEPEDWEPLIASELVYMDKFQGRLWRGLLPRVAIPTIMTLLTGVLLWLSGILDLAGTVTSHGNPVPVVDIFLLFLTLASFLLVFPAYFILGLPFSKNLRLLADQEAVQVTGKTRFVNALTKVGNLIPKLLSGKRPDSRYPYDRPSIKRRIAGIQAANSQ